MFFQKFKFYILQSFTDTRQSEQLEGDVLFKALCLTVT